MAAVTTLPATFVAGDVLTAAQMNNLRGAFRVLQTVSVNSAYSGGTTVSSPTYVTTGLTATITPSSTSSKILVMYSNGNRKDNGNAATEVLTKIYRNGSAISGSPIVSTCYTNSAMELRVMGSCIYLDSPATTSATTYTLFGAASAGTAYFDFFCVGSLTLMEISA